MPSDTIAYKWKCPQCNGWKMRRCPACCVSEETPCNCDYDQWEREGDHDRISRERYSYGSRTPPLNARGCSHKFTNAGDPITWDTIIHGLMEVCDAK